MTRSLLDCAIAAAALWTVAYHLGLVFGVPVLPLAIGSLIAFVPLAVVLFRWRPVAAQPAHAPAAPGASTAASTAASAAASAGPGAAVGAPAADDDAGRSPGPLAVGVTVTAAALAAVSATVRIWPALLTFAVVAVVAGWSAVRRSAQPSEPARTTAGRPPRGRRWDEIVVLAVALLLAGLSTLIVRPDGDDVFYVNRSVWVAENGRLPVGDVLFGEDGRILPGMAPVSSIEALAGTVARLVHVPAASVIWYVVPPVVTFLAVLALWRLVGLWARRRPLACLLLAVVFLLWSGASPASFGSFHLVRAWQGKAILVSLAVPALWAYLTEWAQDRSRRGYLLALLTGVAAVGFSSSATFVVPLIVAAAGIGLALRRQYRALPLLGAIAAYPVLVGLAVSLAIGAPAGAEQTALPVPTAWQWVIGLGVAGLVGTFAVWSGPVLVRAGVPAAFAWGGAAMTLLLLVPGVMDVINRVTGSGPVLWRMLWLLPAPALVGLLAAPPRAALHRLAGRIAPRAMARIALEGAAEGRSSGTATSRPPAVVARLRSARVHESLPAVGLAAVLVLAAVPVWSGTNRARVVLHPQWKTDADSGRTAAALLAAYPAARMVLATPGVMRAIAVRTAEVKVVDPRGLYLTELADGTAESRRLLSGFAARRAVPPPAARLRTALTAVRVDVACVQRGNRPAIEALHVAGYGGDRRIRYLTCLTTSTP